jgi:ADP-ribose pyrophosphatase YjhB (NUDIX family)
VISPRLGNRILICCPLCSSELKNIEIGGRERLTCINCEFVHWDNPKPVTATLVPFDGGLVLVKRKFEPFIGDWCLPGGFIEACEHPGESAAREVLEETGLTIKDEKLIWAASPGRNINVVILFYEAGSASGPMVPGDDASEVGSFTQDRLPPNIAFELHRKMIKQWFEARRAVDIANRLA